MTAPVIPLWTWLSAVGLITAGTGIMIWSRKRPADLGKPSPLYGASAWEWGTKWVGLVPSFLLAPAARTAGRIYAWCVPSRREVVVRNLLPLVGGDKAKAETLARKNFAAFALKLTDLWRYEAGKTIDGLFGTLHGWEHFLAAQQAGRGVILVTPHLGNWEFGAPLLRARGVSLLVLTQPEPDERLTAMRQRARERWGIRTLVVGTDPFAAVTIIQQLEAGAVVALLIDRPPPPTGVVVSLAGCEFKASVSVAELARASGCAVVPVYLPRVGDRYQAHMLPAIPYERAALRDRAARIAFTQEIIRAFEPAIRQHADQWFHFVPIWMESTNPK